MDTRTYPRDHQHGDALSSALAEVARLRAELARQQDMTTHAIQAATTARANATELGKALDMALAERDELRTELLGTQNARDFLRASLHTERIMHNAELDTMRAELADVQTAYHLCDAMREDAERELDAMRQAHSVIAARMEAMGC